MATYTDFGKYTEGMSRGLLYVYKCPAQALLLAATTGGHPTLFNPGSSGKLFVPTRLTIGYVSGTTTIGSVLLAETLQAGSAAATGSPILTATLVSGVPALRGGGVGNSAMQWSPTTNTFTAAPTVLSATSINLGAADPTNSGHEHTHLFDGMLGFAPGSAMSIVYSVTTTTALYHVTLYGLEVPYPLTATT